ncbi:MAG: hypothetical protein ACREIC_25480, partial [Limisphaerales bacterium]
MNLDANLIQLIRQTPLFGGLKDDQLDCIRAGEIIDLLPGAIPVEENTPAEFFFLTLDGEMRVTRQYDHQEVLLAV